MKNQKGITLVALVVTIVVLLILAGITIMYVLSDNGIIGQAQKAATDTGADHINSSYALALAATQIDYYDPTGTICAKKDDGSAKNDEEKIAAAKTYFEARLTDYSITSTGSVFTITDGALKLTKPGTCTYNTKPFNVTYGADGKFSAQAQ